MRIPILLEADKSVTTSASSLLREGHWRITCNDPDTNFRVVTSDSNHDLGTDFRTLARTIKVIITKRSDRPRISIFAERIGDGINS